MEEALELIYRGQCNVAVKAKEIGVSTEELKRLFRVYAMQRPIDEDVWRGDVELGGPGLIRKGEASMLMLPWTIAEKSVDQSLTTRNRLVLHIEVQNVESKQIGLGVGISTDEPQRAKPARDSDGYSKEIHDRASMHSSMALRS